MKLTKSKTKRKTMKQFIAVLAVIVAVGVLTSGCTSTNASKLSAPASAVTTTIVATPDVEKGDRISGNAQINKILWGLIVTGDTKYADGVRYTSNVGNQETGFLGGLFGGESYDRAKAAAAYKACEDNHADVILCPSYALDRESYFFFSKTTCRVDGFKGVIKGIKSIETKDYLETRKYTYGPAPSK
jgi:hypothetical protein